jgi:hypothetical protein
MASCSDFGIRKLHVSELEGRCGTSRTWPSSHKNRAKLRHASNISSRVQSSFSFPATVGCDVTCFVIDKLARLHRQLTFPWYLHPLAALNDVHLYGVPTCLGLCAIHVLSAFPITRKKEMPRHK